MKQPITLIKGEKIGVETDYRDALPVNMYAINRKILNADGYMKCFPGLTQIGTGLGVDRGGVFNDARQEHFRVSGSHLVKLNHDGSITDLGDCGVSTQVATPFSFNTQAVIGDGVMYLYDGASLDQVTDADLGSPIDGVWISPGYYFLTDGDYIYHTELSDETSINALDYGAAEFMPDGILGVSKDQDNKAMVWGRYSLEYFIYDATASFAFRKVDSRAQKIGIVSTFAKTEIGGVFYIVGGQKNDGIFVYAVTVGGFDKISTREIDKILKSYVESELSDIRVESRQVDDVSMVIIHLPNETLLFNITVAKSLGPEYAWSILKTDVVSGNPYRGINSVFDPRTGYWVVGDRNSAPIGKIDDTVFTHYEDMVEWILYTPLVKLESMSINELEIETIPGHTTTQDAKVSVSITKDGLTYSSEYHQMYGTPSDYDKRFILRRLGNVNNWIGFKFRGATTSLMSFGLITIDYD